MRSGRSQLPYNDKSTPNNNRVQVRPAAVTWSTTRQIEALNKIDLDKLKMANPISIEGPEPAITSLPIAIAHAKRALESVVHESINDGVENEGINENDLDLSKIKDKQLKDVVKHKWIIKPGKHFLWRNQIEPDAI